MFTLATRATIIAIILNIALPALLEPFATADEVKPPEGAANLSYKGQFMHMMVHHKQVMFMSSLIVALIVFLSVVLAQIARIAKFFILLR
tara:strand:+ start:307 stop:576 length:270 start_codon:yes stop_codon:yes gene_type:complete